MLDNIGKLIRTIVRPGVTAAMTVATITMILVGTSIPDQWWPLFATVVAFWFATRTSENSS